MMRTVDRAAVQQLLAQGATAVEALPGEYYRQGHLPGAINLPLDELDSAPARLPAEVPVVVYCTDAACSNSMVAGRRLWELGYAVHVYEGGKRDWADAGLPLEGWEVAR